MRDIEERGIEGRKGERREGDRVAIERDKHKPTNVGRIALERQARAKKLDPTRIRTIDLPLHNHLHCRLLPQIFGLLQPTLY